MSSDSSYDSSSIGNCSIIVIIELCSLLFVYLASILRENELLIILLSNFFSEIWYFLLFEIVVDLATFVTRIDLGLILGNVFTELNVLILSHFCSVPTFIKSLLFWQTDGDKRSLLLTVGEFLTFFSL